jgi:hypothetical protein
VVYCHCPKDSFGEGTEMHRKILQWLSAFLVVIKNMQNFKALIIKNRG